MNSARSERRAYREHLDRLARHLTTLPDAEDESADELAVFAEENVEKRAELLQARLPLLTEAFDDLGDLLAAFCRAQPLRPCTTDTEDGERFLDWLERAERLSPEQADYVTCQRGRHAVELRARRNRSGHVRFQELWSVAKQLAADLPANPSLRVHLNPIRASAVLRTPALLDGLKPPASVLFYAVAIDVCTSVLDATGRRLVRELAAWAPCSLRRWAERGAHEDIDKLAALCREFTEVGLVALS